MMSKKIQLQINNRVVEAEEGMTILEAAKINGIHIPTLCYLKDLTKEGACRVCQVEVEGARGLCTACVYPVNEGMKVFTHTKRVLDARRNVLEFLGDIKSGKSSPLKNITSNYHYHKVSADSEETLNLIEEDLRKRGFLVA